MIPVKKAVVLLAGFGTRCLPITKTIPKAMISILNKPIIEYIVTEIVESGIEEIIFVLPKNCNGNLLLEHFRPNIAFEKFLKERGKPEFLKLIQNFENVKIRGVFAKPNGSGGALLATKKFLKNQPYAVLNGDDLFFGKKHALSELLTVYNETGKSVLGLSRVPIEERSKYGIADGKYKNGMLNINRIIEKPKKEETCSNFALVGRYILTQDFISYLEKAPKHNEEIWLTDAMAEMAEKSDKMVGKVIDAKRFDCGNKFGILEATLTLALKDNEINNKLKAFLNKKENI